MGEALFPGGRKKCLTPPLFGAAERWHDNCTQLHMHIRRQATRYPDPPDTGTPSSQPGNPEPDQPDPIDPEPTPDPHDPHPFPDYRDTPPIAPLG